MLGARDQAQALCDQPFDFPGKMHRALFSSLESGIHIAAVVTMGLGCMADTWGAEGLHLFL